MMEQPICGTPITGHHVADHLKTHFGPDAVLQALEGEKIAIGQGYGSHILRVQLKWSTDRSDLPRSIIVKAPTLENFREGWCIEEGKNAEETKKKNDEMESFLTTAHNAECRLYQILDRESPIKIPNIYGMTPIADGQYGMLLMEDLSSKAAVSPSYVRGMTLGQVRQVVDQLAQLQAWSLTTSIDWRSQIPSIEDQRSFFRKYIDGALKGVTNAKEKYPEYFGDVDLEKIARIVKLDSFMTIMTEYRGVMDDVLAHGDFHKNNMLFEKDEDGAVSDRLAAIIDFQVVRRGSPASDLARLFSFSVSKELRRSQQDEMLHYFYDRVISLAGKDKFGASFDQLLFWYKRHLANDIIFIISWTSSMLAMLSNGEPPSEREENERKYLENVKDAYNYAMTAFD